MLNKLKKPRVRLRNFRESFVDKREDMVRDYEFFTGNQLKSMAGKYQGLCPFHEEDTPSFTIFPDTDSFFCFGCKISGSSRWLLKTLKEKYGR